MKLSAIIALLIFVLVFSSCRSPVTKPAPSPGISPEPTPTTAPETIPSSGPKTPAKVPESQVDPQETWWLKPQSYTYQGDTGYMLEENYTVVWWGRGLTSPEKIRTEIKAEIECYHAIGIRYIVPISLFDIEDSSDLSVIKEVSAEMMEAIVLKLDGTPLIIVRNFGDDPEATQYAYDVNHPKWRQYVIEQALAEVDAGADGISIDDVNGNLWWVGNGWGDEIEADFQEWRKQRQS